MFRESYLQQKKWDVEKAILKFDTLTGKKSKVLHKRFLWSCAAAVFDRHIGRGNLVYKIQNGADKTTGKSIACRKGCSGKFQGYFKVR